MRRISANFSNTGESQYTEYSRNFTSRTNSDAIFADNPNMRSYTLNRTKTRADKHDIDKIILNSRQQESFIKRVEQIEKNAKLLQKQKFEKENEFDINQYFSSKDLPFE